MKKPEKQWWDQTPHNPERKLRKEEGQLKRLASYRKTIAERKLYNLETEGRPYYNPPLPGWENGRIGNLSGMMEKSIEDMGKQLTKRGLFKVWTGQKQKKTREDSWLQSNSDLFKKTKREDVEEDLHASMDES